MFFCYIFALLITKILADCPSNSIEWDSQCLTFYANSTQFFDAELICKNAGGDLVSVHDGIKNALLAQESTKYFHESTENDFWIGATNLMAPPVWNWTDGTAFNFNDWKNGEPQNTSGSNCVALSMIDGYWTAQDCYKSKPFVCFSKPSYPVYANCTPGWFYLASTHSCYGTQYGGFRANWTTANSNCESFSAILPSMHSVAEFQLLRSFVMFHDFPFWTGIYTVDGGREWKNSDGPVVDFLNYGNWCSHQPTNLPGQRCIALGADVATESCYRDYDCHSLVLMSLCKKEMF